MSDTRKAIENDHASRVREMFATIAGRYDLLNHLLSGQMDKRWRRLVARRLRERLETHDSLVLDVACGTGDLSLELFETIGARVVATDFCRPMLDIAARKVAKLKPAAGGQTSIPLIEGDALRLPFIDRSFDGVTIAFGLRNLSNVERGLAELFTGVKAGSQSGDLRIFKTRCSWV